MKQRFYVDDLVSDSTLLAALKYYGADSLRRISPASPCQDTLSLSRKGDTLRAEDYLWMVLYLDNDTSAVDAATFLTVLNQDQITLASLNFKYKLHAIPNESEYQYQTSFKAPFDVETAWGYETTEFDLCPYDRNQMVIYVSMFAPELEKANQVVRYNWVKKSGKIEAMADFQDPNVYYTGINWLAKSTFENNYTFFSPGSSINNNLIYSLENNTHDTINNYIYYSVSNQYFEFKIQRNSPQSSRKNYINGIEVNTFSVKNYGGFIFDNQLRHVSNVYGDHKEPVIDVYEFNNYKIGKRIAQLDIHNEHCLHAEGISLAFIDEDHLVFSAFKEESKYIPNKNFFDLYVYNFKTDELVDTFDVGRVFDFID